MKKEIVIFSIALTVLILIASIPAYQNWSYIRFWLGFRIVQTPEGARFPVNQIDIDLRDDTTRQDAEEIARVVNGRIIGEIPSVKQYLIEVPSRTIGELDALIAVLNNLNDPRIGIGATHNIMIQFDPYIGPETKARIIIIYTIFAIIILVASIPIYKNWPYIRFRLGFRIVTGSEGTKIVVNNIQINLRDDATRQDAEEIARVVNGRIVRENFGNKQYVIEVPSRTHQELESLITALDKLNDLRIKSRATVSSMIKFDK